GPKPNAPGATTRHGKGTGPGTMTRGTAQQPNGTLPKPGNTPNPPAFTMKGIWGAEKPNVDDATPNGTGRGWPKPGVTTGPRKAGAIPTRNPPRCAIRSTLRTATKPENRASLTFAVEVVNRP